MSCAGSSTEAGAGAAPRRQLYGRRHGPRLRPSRQALIDRSLAARSLALPAHGQLDPATLFPEAQAVWLEIGFGGGDHLAAQAGDHPEIGMIGVEPFVNGVARLLALAEARGLANLRILADDARLLLHVLTPASLGRIFVLFPDPWPKQRHRKRRIVNPDTLALMARALAPGGELRLATDDADYARAMRRDLGREPALEPVAYPSADASAAIRLSTRYEHKALQVGREPAYLCARKRAAPAVVTPEHP